MKTFVWFTTGAIFGVLSLLIFQAWRAQSASFEDLKFAVAPSFTPVPMSSPARNLSPTAISNTTAQVQYFNGQWTTTAAAATPGRGKVTVAAKQTQNVPIVQSTAQSMGAPTVAAKPKGHEVSVFLDREQQINARSRSYRIFVHDHGSDTISVRIGYGPYTRVKKATGTDSVGDNKVLIHSDGSVRLFHVNSPRAPQNCCLIEVVSAT